MVTPATQSPDADGVVYQIVVQGSLHHKWSDWFGGLQIRSQKTPDGSQVTILEGALQDQAALRGILIKLLDLNLVLISVQQNHARLNDCSQTRKNGD
jgi:hypothetical protein